MKVSCAALGRPAGDSQQLVQNVLVGVLLGHQEQHMRVDLLVEEHLHQLVQLLYIRACHESKHLCLQAY